MKLVRTEYLNGNYHDQTSEEIFQGTLEECRAYALRMLDAIDANDHHIVSVTYNSGLRNVGGVTFLDYDEVFLRNDLVTQSFLIVP